jgi:hypothetical protein
MRACEVFVFSDDSAGAGYFFCKFPGEPAMGKNAARRYQPLTAHLRSQRSEQVRMTFADIERVIGEKLPASASNYRAWWSNNPSNNEMTRAWLEAGFRSEQVDISGRKVVFRRLPPGPAAVTGSKLEVGFENKLALFGCLKGTVVAVGDLTEPADPEWAQRIDDGVPSPA